ncbi:hypothetical protein C4A76_24070 [Brevibacillus laterosporus]|uniref:hypothetical protein n=1 Tax=Brevibacillus laterosporus TaxID=1465 RepID=UPI000CE2BA2B|nr:hypothetical protein [Brevibacillus laterosporus]PPA81168.1 hypothetical protein C4A76_24070 [Brevibacillus laterosporus]
MTVSLTGFELVIICLFFLIGYCFWAWKESDKWQAIIKMRYENPGQTIIHNHFVGSDIQEIIHDKKNLAKNKNIGSSPMLLLDSQIPKNRNHEIEKGNNMGRATNMLLTENTIYEHIPDKQISETKSFNQKEDNGSKDVVLVELNEDVITNELYNHLVGNSNLNDFWRVPKEQLQNLLTITEIEGNSQKFDGHSSLPIVGKILGKKKLDNETLLRFGDEKSVTWISVKNQELFEQPKDSIVAFSVEVSYEDQRLIIKQDNNVLDYHILSLPSA